MPIVLALIATTVGYFYFGWFGLFGLLFLFLLGTGAGQSMQQEQQQEQQQQQSIVINNERVVASESSTPKVELSGIDKEIDALEVLLAEKEKQARKEELLKKLKEA